MPSHKFTYFPVRGLDEFIRLMFHYTKVPFKDNRIAFNDWPNLKPSIAGRDDWGAAQVDALGDFYKEFGNEIRDYVMLLTTRSQDGKETAYKEKFVPAAEKCFPILVRYLKESGSGFFFKSGVTWVGFFIANAILSLNSFHPEAFEKYKELKEHCDRVHSLSQLKGYIASRPTTPFQNR